MHYCETIELHTLEIFLQTIEEFKNKGYQLIRTKTDKRVTFDGKNTVGCQASISAILEQGTATYTVVYVI